MSEGLHGVHLIVPFEEINLGNQREVESKVQWKFMRFWYKLLHNRELSCQAWTQSQSWREGDGV
jgi:hypothetical protein